MKKATIRFSIFICEWRPIFACSTGNKEEKADTEDENTSEEKI